MDEQLEKTGTRFPWKTIVWTIIAIALVVGLNFSTNWLNETRGIQPGSLNHLKILLALLTGLIWLIWLAFFSKFRMRFLLSLVCVAFVVLFFFRYRIVMDGDLGFVRIESRFVEREFGAVKPDAKQSDVDLTKSSSKDFFQFLGNDRDGVVRHRVLNANWKQHPPRILWKQTIGEGWSGFSAVNGYAVTQEQRGQNECVTCYDILTGELKWIYSVARRHEDTMALGRVGPRATPAVHEGRVYAQGGTGVLDCLNGSDGSLIWSVDIPELLNIGLTEKTSLRGFKYQFENSRLSWGRSGSPLIYKDAVIVPGGGPLEGPYATLIAFDKNTGQEKWRGGTTFISYSSPSIMNLLGNDQVTYAAESAAMGFDPNNGDVLWGTTRAGASNADPNCSQVTRLADDRVLLTKGYSLGGEIVRLTKSESAISVESVWKNSRVLKTKMTNPVYMEGYAYSLSDGFLECIKIDNDEEKGKRMWRKRGRFGNGQLLLVGRKLLVHTESGVLKLIDASPKKYNELGEIKTIGGICWNTICLYDKYLLVRSELEAACVELKTEVQIATNQSFQLEMDSELGEKTSDLEPVGSGDE